ncbi:MAG: hypothetical protein AAF518_12640 [Spirochaetota bacterium]
MLKNNYLKTVCKFLLLVLFYFSPQYLFAESLSVQSLALDEFVQEEILQYHNTSAPYKFNKSLPPTFPGNSSQTIIVDTNLFFQESLKREEFLLSQNRLPHFEFLICQTFRKRSRPDTVVFIPPSNYALSQSRNSRTHFLVPIVYRVDPQNPMLFGTLQIFRYREFVPAKLRRYLAILTNSPPSFSRICHRRKPC